MQVSAAQALVFVLALVCMAVVFNVYQVNRNPVRTLPTPLLSASRSQAALLRNIGPWRDSLQKQDITLSCPYLGHDYVARVDLPVRRVVTLDAWNYGTEAAVAHDAYAKFFAARRNARVANPQGCLVHVFDAAGEEVARADQFGVTTSQFAPLPGS